MKKKNVEGENQGRFLLKQVQWGEVQHYGKGLLFIQRERMYKEVLWVLKFAVVQRWEELRSSKQTN